MRPPPSSPSRAWATAARSCRSRDFWSSSARNATEYGIVFILDEVKTGFRIANGGAQEVYSLEPDLATYAKALGNGYPLAAFGGKTEIMQHHRARRFAGRHLQQQQARRGGRLRHAQTCCRSQPILETIARRGQRLMDGLKAIFAEAGIPACFNGYPAMFSFALGVETVTNQRDWNESDKEYYLRLVEAAIERGVMPDHDPREPWFLCYSHGGCRDRRDAERDARTL